MTGSVKRFVTNINNARSTDALKFAVLLIKILEDKVILKVNIDVQLYVIKN